jgi:6,7-dimethyl-8-ribityllumazine synthase
MRELRGTFDARGRRFAVAAAAFNEMVVGKLVEGAIHCFRAHGVSEEDLLVAWVPGSFDLPIVARRLAASGLYDAVVCVGAVIRGETSHFDYVAGQAARGLGRVGVETGVPVTFGVLTTETIQQALDRAGGKYGNKGWDAAIAALQLSSLLDQLPSKE